MTLGVLVSGVRSFGGDVEGSGLGVHVGGSSVCVCVWGGGGFRESLSSVLI